MRRKIFSSIYLIFYLRYQDCYMCVIMCFCNKDQFVCTGLVLCIISHTNSVGQRG